MLRRSHSPASQASADHRRAVGVNRDASLFSRAPGSGLVARHAAAARPIQSDNAARRTGPHCAGRAERSLRHNKSGRGRNSCRSTPGYDNPRKGTAVPMLPRHETPTVDERHDCQDIGPACVPSTVWGTASMRNRQVEIGAVLALQKAKLKPPTTDKSGRSATLSDLGQAPSVPRTGQRK